MRELFLDRLFFEIRNSNCLGRPGKYDRTLQAISAVDCISPFGSYILTENVVDGGGNFRIFGGLPKPGFRHR